MTDTRRIVNIANLYGPANTYRQDIPSGQPLSKEHYGYIDPGSGKFYGDCAAFQKHAQWQSGFVIPYISPNGTVNADGSLTAEASKWYEKVGTSNLREGDSVHFKSGGVGHVGVVVHYNPITGIGRIRSLTGNNDDGQVNEQYFTTNPNEPEKINGQSIDWGRNENGTTFLAAARPRPETHVPEFDRSNLTEAPTDVLITHAPGYAGSPPNSVIMRGYVTTDKGATYRARHILSIAPLCLLLLVCETSQAEPQEAIELNKLVGQKNVDWEKVPGGWRSAGGSVLVQNGQYALVLVKTTEDWIPSKRVSGVLYLGRIAHDDAHMIADFIYCRDKPSTGLKPQLLGGRYREGRYRITAEVKFNRDACRRFYSGREIKRAWRIDYDKGTFTPIDARGLVCEDILIGNEPSTKHCPQ
jgi:hypothetical protein